MTTTNTAKVGEEWISIPEAKRRLKCSAPAVRRLVDSGKLSALNVPGARAKVNAADVAKILASSLKPAM